MTAPTPDPLGDSPQDTPIYTDAAIELFFGIQSNMSMWATAMRNVYEQHIEAQAATIEQLEADADVAETKFQQQSMVLQQQAAELERLRAAWQQCEAQLAAAQQQEALGNSPQDMPVPVAQPKQEDDDA